MSDRGMKKWMPFRALKEQQIALEKLRKEKKKIPKPLISQEQARHIDHVLHHHENREITFLYFEEGEIKTIKQKIRFISLEKRTLYGDQLNLKLNQIIDVDDGTIEE